MKNRISFIYLLCFTFYVLFLSACQTLPKNSEFLQQVDGIDISYSNYDEYSMVSFDVDFNEVELVSFPDENTKIEKGWFMTKYASEFALESGCFVAFDTSPFEVKSDIQHVLRQRKLDGIHKTKGIVVSPPAEYFACLAVKDGKLAILPKQEKKKIEECDYAFGGFFAGVQDGKLVPVDGETKDIRLAVGINENGNRIYILTGQKLTVDRASEILLNSGCHDALHFDGGSSAQLVIGSVNLNGPCVPPGAVIGFRRK